MARKARGTVAAAFVSALCTLTSSACRNQEDRARPQPSAAVIAESTPSTTVRGTTNDVRPERTFGELVDALSEPEGAFFSDTPISNEDGYLQALPWLRGAQRNSVYLGVGPEQNLTYVAQMRPEFAFVLDIRRANLLLHLLFKSLFIDAATPVEWLARLLGRKLDSERTPPVDANTLLQLVNDTEKHDTVHSELLRVTLDRMRTWGIRVKTDDESTLRKIMREFYERDFGLSYRTTDQRDEFVSLRELLTAQDSAGQTPNFLAHPASYEFLRRFQGEHRLVPVVADFAGPSALQQIARELEARHLKVGVFYASNVEEYLLLDGKWASWQRNLRALPCAEGAMLVRSAMNAGGDGSDAVAPGERASKRARWSLRVQPLQQTQLAATPPSYRALFEASLP